MDWIGLLRRGTKRRYIHKDFKAGYLSTVEINQFFSEPEPVRSCVFFNNDL